VDWHPPEHIPAFLPPFPVQSTTTPDDPPTPKLMPPPPLPDSKPLLPPPVADAVAQLQPPAAPSQVVATATATAAPSDYLAQVPWDQSSLGSNTASTWQEPRRYPIPPNPSAKLTHPTKPIEFNLLNAYRHILMTKPSTDVALGIGSPARHKVAMKLLELTIAQSRWDPADTLYANQTPNLPRSNAIGPTFPVAVGTTEDNMVIDANLPPAPPKPISSTDTQIVPLVSMQRSRLPEVARKSLDTYSYSRTTRLNHPRPLMLGSRPLTYGPPVKALWMRDDKSGNAAPQPSNRALTTGLNREEKKPGLPDAHFYRTWDYQNKDHRVPLPGAASAAAAATAGSSGGRRTRMGSIIIGGRRATNG
jgi:hypothetical protein